MGSSHALSGAAVGVVTSVAASVVLGRFGPHGAAEVAAWTYTVVAWSVWSDWDHGRRSTAKNMWGPVSAGPAHVAGRLVGGHRGATHRVAAVAAVALAVTVSHGHPAALAATYAVTVGMLLAAADAVLDAVTIPWPVNLAVSITVAAILTGHHVWWPFTPAAAAVGVATHLAGDKVRVRSLGERAVCAVSLAVLALAPFAWGAAEHLTGA